MLPYRIVNTSDNFGCLMAGRGYGFDLRLPDGTWAPLNAGQGFTADGVRVAPWASFAKQLPVPAGTAPGTYRLRDHVLRRDRGAPSERLDLAAEFQVTA